MYRYRLEREVAAMGSVFAFFGVNPSTADASLDDATVRKWRGFALRNGCRRFIVGNVFSYRATDVRELATAAARGPDHERHISAILSDADILVPCWGNTSKAPPALRNHFDALLARMRLSGKPIMHFGLTQSGDPKHPLMLGYDTPLTAWY